MNESDTKEKIAMREEIIVQTKKFLDDGGEVTQLEISPTGCRGDGRTTYHHRNPGIFYGARLENPKNYKDWKIFPGMFGKNRMKRIKG